MLQLFYDGILICEIATNQSWHVDDILTFINFEEDQFMSKNCIEGIDYGLFKMTFV